MMHLAAWPVLITLVAGFVILLAKSGGIQLQRVLNLLVIVVLIGLSAMLLYATADGSYHVYLLGNWQAPFGIVLVLDRLSALMVAVTSLLALFSLIYAIATDADKKGAHFHVMFQFLLLGLNGSFLTGDIFNLFVFFEILLLASYGLLLHGGGRKRTKAGLHYVVINLVGATLFLFAIGIFYGTLGTLNFADIASKVAVLPEEYQGLIAAGGLLLLVVFGIKAALFPLYLWMPAAYTHSTVAVAAMFAIMTKVGIYAIIRVHGTIFSEDAGVLAFFHMPWVLGLGLITLLLAAFGVIASRGLREQVAYLVLASVATLLIAVGLNNPLALSATLYYLIHSTFIAAGMFLLADIISRGRGGFKDTFARGFAMPSAILIGSVFMFSAVAMTGLPPLSGFFGKVMVLKASLDHAWFGWVIGVVLFAGFIMIVSMARTGSLLFYDTLPDNEKKYACNYTCNYTEGQPLNRLSMMAVIALFAISPILVIFAQPITAFTAATAKQQLNSQAYIEAVLSQEIVHSPWRLKYYDK